MKTKYAFADPEVAVRFAHRVIRKGAREDIAVIPVAHGLGVVVQISHEKRHLDVIRQIFDQEHALDATCGESP